MPTDSRLSPRLGRYLAACAAVTAAAAHHAAADVNYWPDANLVIPANIDGLYINVEARTSGSAGSVVAGWDINPYSATSLTWFNATGTGMLRYPGVTTGSAGNLPLNTPVAATGSYGSGAVVVGANPGNWQLNAANYFGFRFVASDGLTHYGWGKFVIGSAINGADRTITELAWETLANTPINVGDTGGPPPDYDPCATFNPTASVGTSTLGYRSDATVADVSACGATIHRANFYKFTVGDAGSYTFQTCPTSGAARLAIFSACTGGAALACGSPACGSGESITTTLEAGSTVWVVIGGATADAGLGNSVPLVVTAPPITACVNAVSAPFGISPFSNDGFTVDQTVRATATNGTSIIYKASWYKFVPGVNGLYTFSLCGSVNDTKMAIGTACPATGQTFQSLAYNDDTCACSSGCGTTTQSNYSSKLGEGQTTGLVLNTELTAGTTYYVVIGGYGATTLAVSGNLEITGPPQPSCQPDLNDDNFVNGDDLGILLGQWGACSTSCSADFNNDGFVNGDDLGIMLGAWGACP